jgi:hypothetical protein
MTLGLYSTGSNSQNNVIIDAWSVMPIVELTGNLLLFFDFSLASENVAGTQDA